MAVLAVAFVVLAAVPAVLTDSDVSDASTTDSKAADDVLSVTINEETTYYNSGELATAVSKINSETTKPVTVTVLQNFSVNVTSENGISITNATVNVTLDGDGHTIKATGTGNGNVINIAQSTKGSNTITIEDLTIDAGSIAKHGINVYKANASLDGVTVTGAKGYSLVVGNSSSVSAKDVTLSKGGWGAAINIDYGSKAEGPGQTLSLTGTNDLGAAPQINSEHASTDTYGSTVKGDKDNVYTMVGYKNSGSTDWNSGEAAFWLKDGEISDSGCKIGSGVELTVPEGATLTIPENETFTIPAGAALTVTGTVQVEEGAKLVFAKNTASGTAKSFLNTTGTSASIVLDGGSLVIEDLAWKYSTAASTVANEKCQIDSTGKVVITFTTAVDSGKIEKATISGTGTATIKSGTVFPLVPSAVIKVDGAKVAGTIMVSKGISAAETTEQQTVPEGENPSSIKFYNGASFTGTVVMSNYYWDGSAYQGTAYKHAEASFTNVKGGSGEGNALTIAAGSITVTGNLVTGEGTAEDVASKIQGITDLKIGALTITSGKLTLDDDVQVTGTLTVSDEATLEIAKGTTVTVASESGKITSNGTLSIDGTVISDKADGTKVQVIDGTGQVSIGADADVSDITISEDTKTVVDPSAMSDMTVGGDTQSGATTYTQVQIVTVNGYWNLVKGADITIQGKLVVPEGTVLTVQAGAKLTLNGGAVAEIEGTIVVEEGATVNGTPVSAGVLEIQADSTLKVDGIVAIAGTLNAKDKAIINVEQDAILTITEDGVLATTSNPVITVKSSGTMVINGKITGSATILDYGLVTIDSDVPMTAGQTVKLMADGAVVDVVRFTVDAHTTVAKLTITDYGLQATSYKDANKQTQYVTIGDESSSDKIVVQPGSDVSVDSAGQAYISVTGLKAVAKVTSSTSKTQTDLNKAIYNYKQYSKSIAISGSIDASVGDIGNSGKVVSTTTATAGVALSNGYYYASSTSKFSQVAINVTDSLNLDEDVILTVSDGKLSVSGTIVVGAENKFVNNTADLIEVTGSGEISVPKSAISSETNVSAARYTTSATVSGATVKTVHYVTLQAALAVADGTDVREVVAMGTQTLKESAAVAEGVTLNGQSATVNVGSSAGADVALTVADGAVVKGTMTVNVNGSLFAEDKTDIKISSSSIISDVYSEETDENGKVVKDGWALWTNLATAVESGVDTITISKAASAGYVEIASNLTIPAGVTVIVPADTAQLRLADGVTLTVDGVLQTSQDILAKTRFAINAMNVTGDKDYKSSAIVVNGELLSAGAIEMKDGADGTTSLLAGAPIYGAYYSIEDWYVVTTIENALAETDRTSDIEVYGPVVGADGTLIANDDSSKIIVKTETYKPIGANVTDASKVSTTLTMTSLTLGSGASVDASAGAFTGSVVVGENSVTYGYMSGVTAMNSSDSLVLTGTATTSKSASLTVSAGTVSLGYKTTSTSEAFAQDGSYAMKIASGATAKIVYTGDIDNLTVDGTFEVPAGVTASVSKITVNGSVKVAATTASAAGGSLTVGEGYVGISKSDFYTSTGASASVTGPFTLTGTMFVVSGATVDNDMSSYAKTEVYNNGSLWFTAYASGTKNMVPNKAPLTNAVLSGWAKTQGGEVAYETGDSIVIGKDAKLYSVVETDIYTIMVVADEGIANVYLDGNLMVYAYVSTSDGGAYFYIDQVSAGSHKVTYNLRNGYSGEAKLTLRNVDGSTASASGDSATVSGDKGGVVLQLTGIEKSGYVDPVQPVEPKDDDGLKVTDYLLIVLVILVVILAVIVALRLMRS